MKRKLTYLLIQLFVSLVFTTLILWHTETRESFEWGYEIIVCALIGLGISVNLYVKSPDKTTKVHLIKAVCSMLLLWLSYLLFEEVLFRYSTLQYSFIYQLIRPFLVMAVYFFVLKYLYRLRQVIFAIVITELLLGADLACSFFADTMGDLYYPASLLLVNLFVFPAIVQVESNVPRLPYKGEVD